MMTSLFYVDSSIDPVPRQSNEWIERARETGECCDCGGVPPGYYPRPVDLDLTGQPRGIEAPTMLASVFRADLMNIVFPHLKGAVLGKCFVISRGKRTLISDYVTCYSSKETSICLRGGPESRYTRCSRCGGLRLRYLPEPNYLLQSDLSDALAYQSSGHGGLYLAKELVDSIDWSQFSDAEIIEYPVRESSLDQGEAAIEFS